MTEQPAVPVRHTVDTITSDALDELYERLRKAERAANLLADSHRRAEAAEARLQVTSEAAGTVLDRTATERDDARQQAAAIAAQRDRLRQRMHTLANRWDDPSTPDTPTAQALRAEITVAPFDPDGAMAVREYTERGRTLWAFRCWGTDTCDGWLGLGHHTQTSALAERERHVLKEHQEQAPEGYCPACGRGDVAPTADEYEQQRQRAEAAEATVARVQALADRHPAGIDTAHLHAAIANTPSPDDEPDLPPFVNRDFISHRPQQPTSPAS